MEQKWWQIKASIYYMHHPLSQQSKPILNQPTLLYDPKYGNQISHIRHIHI